MASEADAFESLADDFDYPMYVVTAEWNQSRHSRSRVKQPAAPEALQNTAPLAEACGDPRAMIMSALVVSAPGDTARAKTQTAPAARTGRETPRHAPGLRSVLMAAAQNVVPERRRSPDTPGAHIGSDDPPGAVVALVGIVQGLAHSV
jgi:hypothetical protein